MLTSNYVDQTGNRKLAKVWYHQVCFCHTVLEIKFGPWTMSNMWNMTRQVSPAPQSHSITLFTLQYIIFPQQEATIAGGNVGAGTGVAAT